MKRDEPHPTAYEHPDHTRGVNMVNQNKPVANPDETLVHLHFINPETQDRSTWIGDSVTRALRTSGGRIILDVSIDVGAAPLPHDDYATAVHQALTALGIEPDRTWTETPDGQQLDAVCEFRTHPAIRAEWPGGVFLGWDQSAGRSVVDQSGGRTLYPLEIGAYASPAAAEETGELRDADTDDARLGELADVLEVVYALADTLPGGREALHVAREAKLRERGGFGLRLVWDGVAPGGSIR
jgi:hypothetical protein